MSNGFIKLIFVLIIGSIIVGGGVYLLEIEDKKSVSGVGERIDQDLVSLRKKLAERRIAAESKLKNIVQEEQNKFEKNLGIDRLKTADIDTSAWKTYRNEKYGFEVKYPPLLAVASRFGNISNVGFENLYFYNPKNEPAPPQFFIRIVGKEKSISLENWVSRNQEAYLYDTDTRFSKKEEIVIDSRKGFLIGDPLDPVPNPVVFVEESGLVYIIGFFSSDFYEVLLPTFKFIK